MKQPAKILFVLVLYVLTGCAGNEPIHQTMPGVSLLSPEIKKELRTVEQSIVGLDTEIKYEIQRFEYIIENDQFIPDSDSPVGYKLSSSNNGVSIESESRTLKGGGLIIDIDLNRKGYCILTSSHLVSPPDTVDVYYQDESGKPTDVLFARHVLRKTTIAVRGRSNWLSNGNLIADDKANDIAIIYVETDNALGNAFGNPIGYDMNLDWGDWVFLFGYPNGIKQMSGGWISKSPYPGTFAIDAAIRFGFSGGPLFVLTSDHKLAYVGMIKSAPRRTLDYITPGSEMPIGYMLNEEDFYALKVTRENLVEYGTAYCVAPKTIRRFMRKYRDTLVEKHIVLDPKYFD